MRLIPLILASVIAISAPTQVHVQKSSSAWNSINNINQNIDYKDYNFSEVKEDTKKITGSTDYDESLDSEPVRNIGDLSLEMSYLIENGIINRKSEVYLDPLNNTTKFLEQSNQKVNPKAIPEYTDPVGKSDLYMGLYRAKFDVIESRYLRVNLPSIRGGSILNGIVNGYYGTSLDEEINTEYVFDGDFRKGDFWVYVAPDVYELYFYELLNKSILNTIELDGVMGKDFVNEYNKLNEKGMTPDWWTSKGQADANKSKGALGHSYDYNKTMIARIQPQYFSSENLDTLEALKIIEQFLRATEKDMTKMEASIVTYKYGINYLYDLSDSDRETVEFLIAKGILNFEEPSEFINLYGEFTEDIAYKLLYRIANVDARFNFSLITLTDSQSYWKEKGYLEDSIELYEVTEIPNVYGEQNVEEEDVDRDRPAFKYLGWLSPMKANAATTMHTITKNFPRSGEYYYKSIKISDLASNTSLDGDVSKIKKKTIILDGVKTKVYEVKFSIAATSKENALRYVDNCITFGTKSSDKVTGVSKIESNGSTLTLVPASSLRAKWTDIEIVEDKVLRNKETGVTAILLPDMGYSLVGNQVIVSDVLMETTSNNEVYYNLEIIASLLSNASLVKLSSGSSLYKLTTTKEVPYKVYGTSLQKLGNAYVTNYVHEDKEFPCYNINTITNGVNTLLRDYEYKLPNGNKTLVTVVVEWKYIVPNADSFNSDTWYSEIKGRPSTVQDITNAMYTRPTEPNLQIWWDSNYGMSNALANFVYGTEGVEYVKSGYLAPSLTILLNNDVEDAYQFLQDFFRDYNFELRSYDGVNYNQYVGSTMYRFWTTYFAKFSYGNSTIQALTKAYREFSILKGVSVSNSSGSVVGTSYGDKFIKSSAGVMYKNVAHLPNASIDTEKKTITFSTRHASNVMDSLSRGSVIEDTTNNVKWSYLGVENGYIKLAPLFQDNTDPWAIGYPYLFKYKENFQVTLASSNSPQGPMDIDRETLTRIPVVSDIGEVILSNTKTSNSWVYNKYFKDYAGTGMPVDSIGKLFHVDMSYPYLVDGDYYLSDGTIVQYKDGKLKQLDSKTLSNNVLKSSVTAIPIVYLPAGDYGIERSEDKASLVLVKGSTANALLSGNVYYSGISSMVIDNIIAKYVKTTDFKSVPNGSSIIIGDTVWYKNNEYLETIVKDPKAISAAKSGSKSKLKLAIQKYFTGLGITVDNKVLSLNNYFEEYSVGSRLSANNKDGIVYFNGTDVKVYKDDKDEDLKSSAKQVSLRVKLEDSLYLRSISSAENLYTIMYTANLALETITDDLPFYAEDLSYESSLKNSYDVDNTDYKNSVQASLVKESFEEYHKRNLLDSFIELVKQLMFIAGIYFMIVSWVCKVIVNDAGLKLYLDKLSLKDSGGRKGIDLIKLVSCGLYNLDNDISYLRTIFISIMSLVVAYLAWKY